jgi:HEAT repeat protein
VNEYDRLRDLGCRGTPAADEELARVVRSDAPRDVRIYACAFLGDSRVATDALIAVLEDREEDPQVRGAAAEWLGGRDDQRGVPALLRGLEDPSDDVRFWSAFALHHTRGNPDVVAALERIARDDSGFVPNWGSVRREAADALASIRGGTSTWDSDDRDGRVIETLAELWETDAESALARAVADPDERMSAWAEAMVSRRTASA